MKITDIQPGAVYALKNHSYTPTPAVALGPIKISQVGLSRFAKEVMQTPEGSRTDGLLMLSPVGDALTLLREWATAPAEQRGAPPVPDAVRKQMKTIIQKLRAGERLEVKALNDEIGAGWYWSLTRAQSVVGEYVEAMAEALAERQRHQAAAEIRSQQRARNERLLMETRHALTLRGIPSTGALYAPRIDGDDPRVEMNLSALRKLLGLES